MNEIPLWNRINLPAPATSAHKVDLSDASHLRGNLAHMNDNTGFF